MNGKPVGTAFAELDLDTSKYDTKSRRVINDAKDSVVAIETAYRRLGVQHDIVFDAMQTRAYKAFHAIGVSAQSSFDEVARAYKAATAQMAASELKFKGFVSESTLLQQKDAVNAFYDGILAKAGHTARDIVNIERAKTKEIAALDAQLYGAQRDALAAPWQTLGIRSKAVIEEQKAQVIAAYDSIRGTVAKGSQDWINAETAKNAQLKKLNDELVMHHESSMAAMTRAVLRWYAAYYVVSTGISTLTRMMLSGIEAVDRLKIAETSIAAQVTQFSANRNLGEAYKEAYAYAQALVPVLETIDEKSFASGQQIMDMARALGNYGVFLDSTNKKQVQAFTSLSNMVALLTAGQPNQFYQEMNGLLEGVVNKNNRVATQIDAQIRLEGIYRGGLKEVVDLGKEHGDLLQRLEPYLRGINAATKDIEGSWMAVKSSLETTWDILQRDVFSNFYKVWVEDLKEINKWLRANSDILAASVIGAYHGLGAVVNLMGKDLVGAYAHIKSAKESIDSLANKKTGDAKPPQMATLPADMEKQYESLGAHSKRYYEDQRKQAFDALMAIRLDRSTSNTEMLRAEELFHAKMKKINDEESGAKEKGRSATRQAASESDRLLESWNKTKQSLQEKIDLSTLEGIRKEFAQNDIEAARLKEQYKDLPAKAREVAYAQIDAAHKAGEATIIQKAQTEAEKDYNQELDKTTKAYQSLMDKIDPTVKRQDELAKSTLTINAALAAGIITANEAAAAIARLNGFYSDLDAKAYDDFKKKLDDIVKPTFDSSSFSDSYMSDIANVATAMEKLSKMYEEQTKQVEALAAARREAESMSQDTESQRLNRAKAISEVEKASAKAQVNNIHSQVSAYRTMVGTVANLYDENSRARKNLHNIEIALSSLEIAMSLKKAATELFGIETTTAAKVASVPVQVAANETIAVSGAVGSITQAGQLPPPASFASVAAMTALMAGVLAIAGFGLGGSGSSSGSATATTTSDVYVGMAPEFSESIVESYDLLKDTYDMEYEKLTDLYKEMRNLNSNITAIVSSVVNTGGMGAFSDYYRSSATSSGIGKSMENAFSGLENISDSFAFTMIGLTTAFASKYAQKLASKISSKEVESYLIGSGVYIGGGGTEAGVYRRYMTNVKETDWGSTSRSQYVDTKYKESDDLSRLFGKTFGAMRDSVSEMATELGGDVQAAYEYVIKFTRINLKGLDSEEISEKLSNYLSGVADEMASAAMGGLLKKYQELNESLYETAARLYRDKVVVEEIFEMTNTSVNLAAQEFVAMSESLIGIAGDLDALQEAAANYYDAFFTDAEKQARLQGELSEALAEYNLSLPDTREGYRALVESLDLTTESGREAYVALLEFSESADSLYDSLEDASLAFDDLAKTIEDWLAELTLNDTLAPPVSMESYQAQYEKLRSSAYATGATSEDITDFLDYATSYLEYMRAYGGDYQGIYDTVTGDVAVLGEAMLEAKTVAELQLEQSRQQTILLYNIATGLGVSTSATPLFASGGLATRASILGEIGPEWAVPTYEPQRSNFLKNAPSSFWDNLLLNSPGISTDGDGEQTIHVHVNLDGTEIGNAVVKQTRSNTGLVEAIRKVAH